MNKYIKDLQEQGKLNLSIDLDTNFNWKHFKIAGPCSVEGPSIIEIANEIKLCGADALRAGAYKPYLSDSKREKWLERGFKKRGLRTT